MAHVCRHAMRVFSPIAHLCRSRVVFGGRRSISLFGGSTGNEPPKELVQLLASVGKGRMDQALKLAKPLAEAAGESPAQFVARACSEHAAQTWFNGTEARERGIGLATTGATFTIPGRIKAQPTHMAEGFWLRDVSQEYQLARTQMQLVRASLAFRGLESPDEVAVELQRRGEAGDAAAKADLAAATRDYHLLGKVVLVQLLTSRPCAVLQAFVGRAFNEEPASMSKYPALFQKLFQINQHLKAELSGPDPKGPLDALDGQHELLPLRQWAKRRQAAADNHLRIISEILSETASSFVEEPEEQAALLRIAIAFYKADSPMAERKRAVKIFQDTANRLGLKL